jgi:hypothetical protein
MMDWRFDPSEPKNAIRNKGYPGGLTASGCRSGAVAFKPRGSLEYTPWWDRFQAYMMYSRASGDSRIS